MSCLNRDIKSFFHGDQILIGEKGTTLSGGQKARLSLTRAFYFDSDIYLLDDPISALDSKVSKKMWSNILSKLRKRKTVIMVTHQVAYLYDCYRIIIMKEGKI